MSAWQRHCTAQPDLARGAGGSVNGKPLGEKREILERWLHEILERWLQKTNEELEHSEDEE